MNQGCRLVVLSFWLNIVIFNAAKSFYVRFQAVRLDPLGNLHSLDLKSEEFRHVLRLLIVGIYSI
ncbi:MAG: hypothetical protein OEM02_10855 [Desulfobulbaceae bacterium]|nr:hypothetical protein [Desulfobulbaceae bacterium]